MLCGLPPFCEWPGVKITRCGAGRGGWLCYPWGDARISYTHIISMVITTIKWWPESKSLMNKLIGMPNNKGAEGVLIYSTTLAKERIGYEIKLTFII